MALGSTGAGANANMVDDHATDAYWCLQASEANLQRPIPELWGSQLPSENFRTWPVAGSDAGFSGVGKYEPRETLARESPPYLVSRFNEMHRILADSVEGTPLSRFRQMLAAHGVTDLREYMYSRTPEQISHDIRDGAGIHWLEAAERAWLKLGDDLKNDLTPLYQRTVSDLKGVWSGKRRRVARLSSSSLGAG